MATPPAPDAPQPGTSPAIPDAVSSPAQPVGEDAAIRDLVQEIVRQTSLGFDPASIKKGIVTALATGTPPTITLNLSGDTTVAVAGVRWIDSYAPQVGDTVLLVKQGAEVLALGRVADGNASTGDWTQASLQGGFSHNGDSQGNLMYRRVWDNGCWKMQWRGAVSVSSGTTVVSGLSTIYRPSTKRKVLAARNGFPSIGLEFTTGGSVVTYGTSYTINSHSHSHNAADVGSHTHSGTVPVQDAHSHGVSTEGHDHSVSAADWISFNGVEYFL